MSFVLITTFVFHTSLIYCNKHLQNKNVLDKCTICEHNTQLFVSDLYIFQQEDRVTNVQLLKAYDPRYLKHEVKTSPTPA